MRTTLTPRELQVLVLVADGLSRQEIADRHGVALETIKSQLKWCRIKMGARGTAHAVALGFRDGLLS